VTVISRRGIHSQIPDDGTDSHADRAVTALYRTDYRSLVRLAALLVPDAARAEQVVQDSFVVSTRPGIGSNPPITHGIF